MLRRIEAKGKSKLGGVASIMSSLVIRELEIGTGSEMNCEDVAESDVGKLDCKEAKVS